jgi:hypothetical protein
MNNKARRRAESFVDFFLKLRRLQNRRRTAPRRSIASHCAGFAGVNLTLTIFDELWGRYVRVLATRLRDESGFSSRARCQSVRNAEANGRVLLKKCRSQEFALSAVPDAEKTGNSERIYLDRFKITVHRYFPVAAGSAPAAFTPFTACYPVFELPPGRHVSVYGRVNSQHVPKVGS